MHIQSLNSAVKTHITQDTNDKILENALKKCKNLRCTDIFILVNGQYCHALLYKACLICTANCEQVSGHPGSHSHPTPSRKEEKGLHVVCTAAVHRKR